jgi:hypothetical protein
MTPEQRTNTDERQPVRQSEPTVEQSSEQASVPLPTPPASVVEMRQEGLSPANPPPAPSQSGIVASVQRMSPGLRWALSLSLAFLSGLGALAALYGAFPAVNPVGLVVTLILTLVFALAAGFTFSSWGAALAMVVAAAVGGLIGSGLIVLASPDTTVEGLKGMSAALILFFWFAVFSIAPLAVILLTGISIGKWRGMNQKQTFTLSTGKTRVS